MHGMPVQSIMKAIINLTDRNQNNSDAVLSLRSGYDSSVEPSQRKKHQPDTLRPHTPYAQLFPAVRNNRRQASTTTPAAPKPFVFPGLVSSNNNNSNNNKKRKTAYFGPPFTRFQALSNDAQQSTHNYLRGDPATNWAVDLGLPLMDMFRDLRCCVLLLCEDENPGLRAVLRDPVAYARFRDGLNPNFLAPDGDFVRGVRELSPGLDARLRDPYQRWRIVLAFRTVDFPAVVEESESEGEGEDAVADGENWDEETIGVDSLGSGDLEMST
ncbi:hypothetical protein F4782DRAFT_449419 [Xylaria castorea]|nr:hypothetical protein F4782DRAFT_449419 [Xylaria castorea]